MTHLYACLGATQVSVRLAPVQDSFGWSTGPNWRPFAKFYASVYEDNFPSLVAPFFSWRCLAASASSFLRAAINLRPSSVTVSTHTSAYNVVAFHSPAMPNARMSLCTVHSFSSLPRPLRTAPSRFSNTIGLGNRPSLVRMSVPAHKSLI